MKKKEIITSKSENSSIKFKQKFKMPDWIVNEFPYWDIFKPLNEIIQEMNKEYIFEMDYYKDKFRRDNKDNFCVYSNNIVFVSAYRQVYDVYACFDNPISSSLFTYQFRNEYIPIVSLRTNGEISWRQGSWWEDCHNALIDFQIQKQDFFQKIQESRERRLESFRNQEDEKYSKYLATREQHE